MTLKVDGNIYYILYSNRWLEHDRDPISLFRDRLSKYESERRLDEEGRKRIVDEVVQGLRRTKIDPPIME